MDSSPLTQVWVPGRPRTKGSLNVYCTRNAQHTVRVEEETKNSKGWRKLVAWTVQQDMIARGWDKRSHLTDGPVEVIATWFFQRQTDAEGNVVPSHQTPAPTDIHLGDLDKLQRNVGDALQDSLLIKDDSQIMRWQPMKLWAGQQGLQLTVIPVRPEDIPILASMARAMHGLPDAD